MIIKVDYKGITTNERKLEGDDKKLIETLIRPIKNLFGRNRRKRSRKNKYKKATKKVVKGGAKKSKKCGNGKKSKKGSNGKKSKKSKKKVKKVVMVKKEE